jgi:predicted transcriptional regulator
MRIDVSAKDQIALGYLQDLAPHGTAITVSVRQIVAATGISRGTVARSLKRLSASGAIRRLRHSGHTQHANRYVVCLPITEENSDPFLWSTHGLGPTACKVFSAMPTAADVTVQELSEVTGASPSTVRTALIRLHSAGLIDGTDLKGNKSPRKRRWRRFMDDEYLKWYEDWLVGEAKEAVHTKVEREQNQWRLRETRRTAEEFERGLRRK